MESPKRAATESRSPIWREPWYNPWMRTLIARALEARQNAYCPYSNYQVGAALLTETGQIYSGCNVENISFGLTICAERGAVMAMAAEGERRIAAVAVATRDGGAPCGACLQVLAEFVSDPTEVPVACVNDSGAETVYNLSDLLPFGFRTDLGGP